MRCENTSSHEQPTTNWPIGRCTATDPAKLSRSLPPVPVSLSASESAVARDTTNRSALRRPRRGAPKSTPAGRLVCSESRRARTRPPEFGRKFEAVACAHARRRGREREKERRVGALYFPPVSSGIPAGIAHCRHGRSFIRSYTYIVHVYVRSGVMEHEYRCR